MNEIMHFRRNQKDVYLHNTQVSLFLCGLGLELELDELIVFVLYPHLSKFAFQSWFPSSLACPFSVQLLVLGTCLED